MKKRAVLVVLFVLLFAISTFGDTDTLWPCSTDLDCQVLVQNGDSYYCSQQTLTCFQLELPAAPSTPDAAATTASPTPAAPTTDEKITALEAKIARLESSLSTLSSDVSLTKGEVITIQNQISSLQSELANLQNSNQDISSKTNSLSTGLAGLQQTLDSLQKSQSFSKVIAVIVVLVLIGGAVYGAYYYINQKQSMVNPEILNYIHNSIKQGKKQHQIKQELRKAGWMDSDIEKAYNETVKENYRRYKSSQPERREAAAEPRSEQRMASRASTQRPALNMADPKKMIIIAVISILVITGGLLVLRASTGQAIFLKKLVAGQENATTGEVTYKIECTPPHLLNPAGDACCLDSDNSGVCDTTELQGAGLAAGGECNDNRECNVGLYCVHNKCVNLDSLYTGEGGDCTKLCSYYAIKVLTSDGEKYDLKPKQGSYTGAGALEWKILPIEQYCKGESPIVPVNVIKKQTGKIISEEVLLLHEGETSKVLTHPTISKLAFSLTIADVFESCPK